MFEKLIIFDRNLLDTKIQFIKLAIIQECMGGGVGWL